MPANQTQRPKFFEEQYLGAADLTAVVDYGRMQQARHALGAHTWGIAIGLTLKETPQAGGAVTVHLLPGYAWDGYGRPIVVLSPYQIPEERFSAIKLAISPARSGIESFASDSTDDVRRAHSSKLPVVKWFSAKLAAANKSPGFRCNHDSFNLNAR